MNFGDQRLPQRFWDKCIPEPMSGCWLWFGGINEKGYGEFRVGSRTNNSSRMVKAHRYAYETLVGAVVEGLECDHRCRLRCCVNPAHLEAVTHTVNMQRGIAGVMSMMRGAAITHCKRGHAFDQTNTYRNKNGTRRCLACERERESRRVRDRR